MARAKVMTLRFLVGLATAPAAALALSAAKEQAPIRIASLQGSSHAQLRTAEGNGASRADGIRAARHRAEMTCSQRYAGGRGVGRYESEDCNRDVDGPSGGVWYYCSITYRCRE